MVISSDTSSTGNLTDAMSENSFPLPYGLSFPIRLSQGQLNLLATCPRKFQHIYLEQLAAPTDLDQQERLLWGSRFHLLLQQWQLGLPIAPLIQEETQLQPWFHAFIQAAPEMLKLAGDSNQLQQQSEHMRTLAFQGYVFTVVYDLLLTDPHQAKILDWKTYPRPINAESLLQNWQTRLYPFVLVETSDYLPEQISMTYWFFQSRNNQASPSQSVTFTYDQVKHEQTRQDLTRLLNQLTHWLERYQAGEALPQVPLAAPCDRCSFAVKCDRVGDRSSDRSTTQPDQALAGTAIGKDFSLPDLEAIQEVPL